MTSQKHPRVSTIVFGVVALFVFSLLIYVFSHRYKVKEIIAAGLFAFFYAFSQWLDYVFRFNETWDLNRRKQYDGVVKTVYLATKAADGTRPVIDTSGNFHELSDIFDVHDYEQDVELFKSYYADIAKGVVNDQCERRKDWKGRQKYDGKTPVFVSEYGGIKWTGKSDSAGWGYGKSVTTEEEFIARYKGLTEALLDNPEIMGFCYTQLYDVEQEKNGLYTYDRVPKFDMATIRAINERTAAIEKE
jgi:hypothetical protein